MKVCHICPHQCELEVGEIGKCKVCANVDGCLQVTSLCSTVSVELIEKKPFFHFFPGSQCLSVGFYGCNLACAGCQNYKVSQIDAKGGKNISPEKLVGLAQEYQVDCIAFTFTEPVIHYEYIMRVYDVISDLQPDIKIVLKSNGFVNRHVLENLDTVTSAWNIDLKGGAVEYEVVCGGNIGPVLSTVETLSRKDSHLEISYLVVPSISGNFQHHEVMAKWLSDLSPDIPVHILFYYPAYRMNEQGNPDDLLKIQELFSQYLRHVYISNIFDAKFINFRHTSCNICNDRMITRGDIDGKVTTLSLECCHKLPGKF